MSSDSPGALHSMLGAMDKRVSEEVRRGGAVGGTEDINPGGVLSVLHLQSLQPVLGEWTRAAVWLCLWPSSASPPTRA